jgi:hypothetical protein
MPKRSAKEPASPAPPQMMKENHYSSRGNLGNAKALLTVTSVDADASNSPHTPTIVAFAGGQLMV